MNYYKIGFRCISEISREVINDVLAAELGEIGFESFAESETGLDAFVPENAYDPAALNDKLADFPLENVQLQYETELVPDRDWNEEWEKNYFKPIVIGNGCVVRASFHEEMPGVAYDLVIDPRMAFGTGNHETTYLMLSEMLKLDLEGKELLDMGCGTAVLAILAARKGCRRVVAVDIDKWAYDNARENIRLNRTPQIEVEMGGAEMLDGKVPFDFIFANINRNILLNDIRSYVPCLKPGGRLFVSGFYTQDIPAIEDECKRNRLALVTYAEKNNWAAVQFVKKEF